MKKLIKALLAVLMLALGISVSAEYTASIDMQGEKIVVNGAGRGKLIITSYGENGEKLNEVKFYDISEYADGVPVSDSILTQFKDEKTSKVSCMLWNDFAHMEPLAEKLDISDIVTVSAKDYDADKTGSDAMDTGRLYFYSDEGKSLSYKIGSNTKLYVNGVLYDDFNDGVGKFIENNSIGNIVLVDYSADIQADGIYDSVFVDYYDTAVVETVENVNENTAKLNFIAFTSGAANKMEIDLTDTSASYSIKDTNGNKMELSELEQNDIVSIKRNPNVPFEDSDFFELTVSRNTFEGEVTECDQDEELYKINGEQYKAIEELTGQLDMGIPYKFYMDSFGRIAWYDEIYIPKQLAILDNAYTVRGTEMEVILILPDGQKKTYTLKEEMIGDKSSYDIANAIVWKNSYDMAGGKNDLWNRVIEYTINQSGELMIKPDDTVNGNFEPCEVNGGFNASSGRLGNCKISREAKILNVSDAGDICPISYLELVDDTQYSGYVFNRSIETNEYQFVLISSDSALGYYSSTISPKNFDDSVVNENTKLYVNGVEIADVNEGIEKYIKHNNSGSVTLIDRLKDDVIDEISVDYYETAVIDSIVKTATGRFEIVFKNNSELSNIVINEKNSDKSYNIFNARGEKYYTAGIDEGDVISIRRDVSKSFESSGFYDIIVSDKTKEGRYPIYSAETGRYIINGKAYAIANGVTVELDEAKSYKLYFDVLGSIAYAEEISNGKNIAVLNAVYTVRGIEHEVSIILPDATREVYTLKESDCDTASQIVYGTDCIDIYFGMDKKPVQDRVIEYTIDQSGELTIVKTDSNVNGNIEPVEVNGEFNASSGRLGGHAISEEDTMLVNAYDINDIVSLDYSLLEDGMEYTAYLYNKLPQSDVYTFALLMTDFGEVQEVYLIKPYEE